MIYDHMIMICNRHHHHLIIAFSQCAQNIDRHFVNEILKQDMNYLTAKKDPSYQLPTLLLSTVFCMIIDHTQ